MMGKWGFLFNKKNKIDTSKVCPKILLVICAYDEIKAETAERIFNLTQYKDVKFAIKIRHGDALIERARSKIASEFLTLTDFDYLFFIDEDVIFKPDDFFKIVFEMQKNDLDVCGAAYPKKNRPSHFAIKLKEDDFKIPFGKNGGIVEAEYISTGFMAIQRRVLKKLSETMPIVHPKDLKYWTFFQPFNKQLPNGDWIELSEDWAFCERVNKEGFKVWLDTAIELKHRGKYNYSWNDLLAVKEEPIDNFVCYEHDYRAHFEVNNRERSREPSIAG